MDKCSLIAQMTVVAKLAAADARRRESRAKSTCKAHITLEARREPRVAQRLLLLLSDGNYHTSDELCARAKIDKHATFYTTIGRMGDRIEVSGPKARRRYRIA
jgi:hypothetical protein